MTDLAGRVGIVTGASSGIGRAIANLLGRAGAQAVLHGRRADSLAVGWPGRERDRLTLTGDLALPPEADRIVRACVDHFARADMLFNCAGIFVPGSATECDDDTFSHVMNVNVASVFRISRAAVRQMAAQGGGAIINISSDWGLVGATKAVAYGVSKGAILQLTRCMAMDHAAENIRVNAVCPGDTLTPMLERRAAEEAGDGAPDRVLASYARSIPLKRLATAEDVAECAVFLASPKAAQITGALVPVDGGVTAG